MAKVLLVEDDNNLREIYQARLMAEGYDIVTAQNGEDALVVAKQNKPDLIISDVMMPRISGFEMLDILRNTAELKNTKVIMLTALGQAEDQTRASNLGADKYLVKSQVTLEDIVNTAKELLDDGSSSTGMTEAAAPAAEPVVPAPPAPVPVASEPVAAALPVAPAPEPTSSPVAAVMPEPPVPPAPTPPPAPAPIAPPAEPEIAPAPAPAPDAVVPEPAVAIEPDAEPDPTAGLVAPLPVPASAGDPNLVSPSTSSSDVSATTPQSLEAEEAALQAQIDNFAQQSAGSEATPEAAPASDVATPTPSILTPPPAAEIAPAPDPTTAPETLDPITAEAANDATLQSAVAELNQPTPVVGGESAPAPAPVTIAPTAAPAGMPEAALAAAPVAPTSEAPAQIAGKKIIQPISSVTPAPDLNALLAKEVAKEAANAPGAAPAPVTPPAPAPPAPTASPTTAMPPAPGQTIDPNTVAL